MHLGLALTLDHGDVAKILHLITQLGEASIQIGDTNRRGSHVDAAPSGAQVERRADDRDVLHGLVRYSIRGKAMVSRICSSPHIHATKRSMPIPNPACGTLPNLRRSTYQSNASRGSLCSSS